MIISIDAEKAFDKIQHSSRKKKFNLPKIKKKKTRRNRNYEQPN